MWRVCCEECGGCVVRSVESEACAVMSVDFFANTKLFLSIILTVFLE